MEPQHYPMPMKRFGTNAYGDNRFRLVLASSRRFLVSGQWNDAGMPRAKWMRLYPDMPEGAYVLEEWQDTFTFTGGKTREQWDMDEGHSLGPYPDRGDYQMCGSTGFNPADMNIEKLISLVHAADKYSWAEKLAACRNVATKDEIDRKHLREAIIRDALPAFGHAPFSQVSTGRGGSAKTSPVLRSANELGLPVPEGIPGQVTSGTMVKKKRKAA